MVQRIIPLYGYLGILLVAVSWFFNWHLEGLRTHVGFFPLWFGYCLVIDFLTFRRSGTSLITRSKKSYVFLFVISALAWWLFEAINLVTKNWYYDGRQFLTDFEYACLATISFSTVMPAVFGTVELLSTFNLFEKFANGGILKGNNKILIIFFAAGINMLLLIFLFPSYFYPFVWGAIFLIIEPINIKLKNRSLFDFTNYGDFRPVLNLMLGCLICGFFWEMWNYYSYPKWIYNAPFVNFARIFEMPAIGYIGYFPFSLELFAIYNLTSPIFNKLSADNYLKIA
jgi:hypothetical protein